MKALNIFGLLVLVLLVQVSAQAFNPSTQILDQAINTENIHEAKSVHIQDREIIFSSEPVYPAHSKIQPEHSLAN